MTIVVEDGSIVANANSYVSEAELVAYASARGITISGTNEQLLIRAMDYLESLDFIGLKYLSTQSLQWPRAYVEIDTYYVDIDEIPAELKKAQIEIALAIDAGNDPLSDIERQKSSVKVGELAVTYENNQSTTIVRKINNSLKKLIRSTGMSFNVDRG